MAFTRTLGRTHPLAIPAVTSAATRRECRSVSAEPVCSCAHFLVHLAHETAGAARTRHSLLPRLSRDNVHANLGQTVPRERGVMPRLFGDRLENYNPHGEERGNAARLRTMLSVSSGAHSRDPLASPGEP